MSLISEYALRRSFPPVRAGAKTVEASRGQGGARASRVGRHRGRARTGRRGRIPASPGPAAGFSWPATPGSASPTGLADSAPRAKDSFFPPARARAARPGTFPRGGLLETRGRVAKEVKSGLAYPVFLVLLSVIVLVLTSGLIVPQLAAVLDPGRGPEPRRGSTLSPDS